MLDSKNARVTSPVDRASIWCNHALSSNTANTCRALTKLTSWCTPTTALVNHTAGSKNCYFCEIPMPDTTWTLTEINHNKVTTVHYCVAQSSVFLLAMPGYESGMIWSKNTWNVRLKVYFITFIYSCTEKKAKQTCSFLTHILYGPDLW